jgi:Cu(I)/Ag(I) efflux system membrane fusion protein
MHPSVLLDHPGQCPICNMDLAKVDPVKAAAPPSSDAGVPGLVAVDLSADRVQLMGMRTAKVERRALAPELRTVGSVAADERGLGHIHVRFAGWIERLAVQETGQKVKKGQLLGTVYSPDLLAAQQELLNALAWQKPKPAPSMPGMLHTEDLTAGLASQARRRLEVLGMSPEDIREVEKSGQARRAVEVRSPVAGYVVQRTAVEGLYVEPGTELFSVADLSKVWVIAEVYEYEMERIQLGQMADLRLAAYPSRSFSGKVSFIYPTVDPETRSLRVRVELANPDLLLRPGMYGDVIFHLPGVDALIVPRDAVVDTGDAQYVFVAQAHGHFEPRAVQIGAREGEDVQIVKGVAEGEEVVTTANFLIDSESRLRAAVAGSVKEGGDDACSAVFDGATYPDKLQQCRSCEVVHRGMGSMVDDCKNAIPKPWR